MAMTDEQIHSRATERAKAERLRAFRLMSGAYAVKSRSLQPGAFHLVSVDADGNANCDCPGYHYRQSCTHSAAVERRIARERKTGAVTRQPIPFRPRAVDAEYAENVYL